MLATRCHQLPIAARHRRKSAKQRDFSRRSKRRHGVLRRTCPKERAGVAVKRRHTFTDHWMHTSKVVDVAAVPGEWKRRRTRNTSAEPENVSNDVAGWKRKGGDKTEIAEVYQSSVQERCSTGGGRPDRHLELKTAGERRLEAMGSGSSPPLVSARRPRGARVKCSVRRIRAGCRLFMTQRIGHRQLARSAVCLRHVGATATSSRVKPCAGFGPANLYRMVTSRRCCCGTGQPSSAAGSPASTTELARRQEVITCLRRRTATHSHERDVTRGKDARDDIDEQPARHRCRVRWS